MKTAIAMIGLLASSSLVAAEPPPLEYFVKDPAYSAARISPGGEYLALTVERGEQDVLTVLRLSDMKVLKVNQLPDSKSAAGHRWISDDRLIFTAIRKVGNFAAPFGTGEWYAVNADGSQPVPVIYYGGRDATQRRKDPGNMSFSMLDPLTEDERNVLMVGTYRASADGAGSEVFMVDTISGSRSSLGRAPRDNCEVSVDEKKKLRYAVCYDSTDDSGKYGIQTELYRRGDDGKWTLVNKSGQTGERLEVQLVSKDGRIYATQSDQKAPAGLGLLDPATGKFQPLFKDPVSDISGYVQSPTDRSVLATVTEAGAPRVTMIQEDHPDAEMYSSLAAAFPGQMVNFSSATRDGKQVVVSVYSDRNPGELYLYDRDSGKARFLMKAREWVDPANSATMRSFSLKSRDGLTLHGYLTIPKGSDGKNLPLIVNPHGGPMGPRDNWGYNWETQLFASRGYATLQVNFRGSGGFGQGFEDKAFGQWHTGIMNDIIDATKWAISQGIADPERVCIYGASFGGYSAMMAPARDQELFKCAFGYVGMYDASIQLKLSDTSERNDGVAYMNRSFGGTRAEQAEMSPVTYADRIKIPVYLAAGARDARCPPEHTEKMFAALERFGNKPEGMIIQSGEQHGFYKLENKVNLYGEMLKFFARHIGKGKVDVGEPEADRQAGTSN